ncbi:glycoside hydrolase family 12 protein [Lentinula detonsa]|uniref:Glycoside hydrolase family 12 protein n=1 Tax=Lentinula detonsa TaxID=2804962 RepID=A0AA38Q2U8_9AGAR|nr:glycoside hydrolase family 12 protein [Lentinula detonsa]
MHFKFSTLLLASISGTLILSSPVPDVNSENSPLVKRGAVLTAQFATESELGGRFILENNLWGEAAATSGSQSSQVTATDGDSVTWETTYTWEGGPSDVKSYANLDFREGLGQSLASITSIPTTWSWSYTSASSDLVADVSYDTWLSNDASSSGSSSTSTFEIMIWLSSRGGAGPAGSQIGTADVNGVTWNLFQGVVETWTVFSFVAPSEITDFNSDLLPFYTFLVDNHGVPGSQFLVQAQAGTEPFVGSATLSTSSYAISIN